MVALRHPRPRRLIKYQVLRCEASRCQVENHADNGADCNQAEQGHCDDEAGLGSVQRQCQGEDQTHGEQHNVDVHEPVHQSATVVDLLELLVAGENGGKNLVEEGVNGSKHGTYYEELQQE